jgi:DNA-binding CsgD family transcriptional regulator
MSERIGVSETDLRRLMDLVDPARCGEPGEFVPDSVLADLAGALGCDEASVQVMDPYRREWVGQQMFGASIIDDAEVRAAFWPAYWEAYAYPQLSGDFVSVTRMTDALPGVRLGPKWSVLQEMESPEPHCNCASVPLPASGSVDRRFLLWRHEGPGFTDRDVMLMALLRPHLIALFDQQRSARADAPALTPRQWEILRLVASGASNVQIARALLLSEATVRKHLENIYARLQVNSRTEALARTSQR